MLLRFFSITIPLPITCLTRNLPVNSLGKLRLSLMIQIINKNKATKIAVNNKSLGLTKAKIMSVKINNKIHSIFWLSQAKKAKIKIKAMSVNFKKDQWSLLIDW